MPKNNNMDFFIILFCFFIPKSIPHFPLFYILKNLKELLNNINAEIAAMEDEQDLIQEAIDDLNSEIHNTMTSIGNMKFLYILFFFFCFFILKSITYFSGFFTPKNLKEL